MFTKITKNLIIFSFIIFSFALVNIASANSTVYAFSRSNNSNKFDAVAEDTGYNTNLNKPVITPNTTSSTVSNQPQSTTTVNNNTSTKTTTSNTTNSKVATSTTKSANVKVAENGSGVYSNLGASAYNANRSAGAVSFMPSTFGGWFLVVLLILAIVILYRMIVRSKAKEAKTA